MLYKGIYIILNGNFNINANKAFVFFRYISYFLSSKNVLLDDTYKAKICDGCLDYKLVENSQEKVIIPIPVGVAKIGYSCHDALAGTVRKPNDIYSFGAVRLSCANFDTTTD